MNRQKHKLSRRILAVLLMAAMLITMLPSAMFAQNGNSGEAGSSSATDSYVTIDKTAEPGDKAGTWDVTLNVKPKNQEISQLSQDVVLVLDTSSSMNDKLTRNQTRWQALQLALTSAEGILNTLADAGARVAVVYFASDDQVGIIGDGYWNLSEGDNLNQLKTQINNFSFGDGRGTDIYAGLKKAQNLLETSTSNASVILLSDGACDISFDAYGYENYRDWSNEYDHSGEIDPDTFVGKLPHNIGTNWNQQASYDYSKYIQEYLDGVAENVKGKAELYSISFASGQNGNGYKTLDRITDDGKLYSSNDYDGLVANFTEITRQILPMIDDPMGEKVEVVGEPTTSLVGSNGRPVQTRPAVVVEGENGDIVRWNPQFGQSLEPGQSLTITYTVQLKDKSQQALAELYGEDGRGTQVVLNGDATLNYYVVPNTGDGKIQQLDFPKPEGTVQIGKLVETTYLDDEPFGEVKTTYALVGDKETFTWNPQETIINEGTNYIHQNSTYDGDVIEEKSHAVEAGEHQVGHYYGTELNGTAVTLRVFVDGAEQPVENPEEFVTVDRKPSSSSTQGFEDFEKIAGPENGVVTYDFDYNPDNGHDCVDLNVSFDSSKYVLQGVEYNQSSGSGSPEQVNGDNGDYTIDNVVAGEKMTDGQAYPVDCTIYLYNKYNVQYYLDEQLLDQDDYDGKYVDGTSYISKESVAKTTATAPQDRVNLAQKVAWKNENCATAISLPELPTKDGYTVSGWNLGSVEGANYTGNTSAKVADVLSGASGSVVPFYATSTLNPKDLTAFNKEVVTAKVDGISGDYQYPKRTENGYSLTVDEGTEVTLLYKITVEGNVGAEFDVTDVDAELVKVITEGVEIDSTTMEGHFTGTIPSGGKVEFYVATDFGVVNDDKDLKNVASVSNTNGGKDPDDPDEEVTVPVDVTPVYKITSIDKFYISSEKDLTEDTASEIDMSKYAVPDTEESEKVIVPNDGTSVTLLYGITVKGTSGATFEVTDTGAELVTYQVDEVIDGKAAISGANGVFTGTIPDDGELTFYVSKQFDKDDIKDGNLNNTAAITKGDVEPGKDEDPVDVPAEEEKATIDDIDKFYVNPEKPGFSKDETSPAIDLSEYAGLDENGNIVIPENGSVTVLYGITVKGTPGASFYVMDDSASFVAVKADDTLSDGKSAISGSKDAFTGTFPADGEVTFYVSKIFDADDIGDDGQIDNTAIAQLDGDKATKEDTETNNAIVEETVEIPGDEELIVLIGDKVTVDCVNGNVNPEHPNKVYGLVDKDHYTVSGLTQNASGQPTFTVTLNTDEYIADYSKEIGKEHKLSSDGDYKFTLSWDGNKWIVEPDEGLVIKVECVYGITDFDKFLVANDEQKKATGLTEEELARFTFPDEKGRINLPKDGKVTLLYGITVTGVADEEFTVTDENALLTPDIMTTVENKDNGIFTGTIPEGGSITFYVEKVFTIDDVKTGRVENEESLVNVAKITEGDVIPGKEDDEEIVPVATGYSLTYEANGGYFANDAAKTTATVGELNPAQYDLWSDAAGTIPVDENGEALAKPTHAQAAPPKDTVISDDALVDVELIGWTEEVPETVGQIYAAGEKYPKLTNTTTIEDDNVVVYAVWGYDENGDGVADATQVIVSPADMDIYTGGSGYESVVDGSGETELGTTENGLPTPGFYITLPYDIDQALKNGSTAAVDLSGVLTFEYEDDQRNKRTWHIERYDKTDGNSSMAFEKYIYRILPATVDGEEIPIRLQFTNTANNNVVTSDDFTVQLNGLFRTFDMTIYPGDLQQDLVTASVTGVESGDSIDVGVGTGTLQVRGVTDQNTDTTPISVGAVPENITNITAQVDADTNFYINESDLEVANSGTVELLVDSNVADSNETLQNSAVEKFDTIDADHNVQMNYLDLVDTGNGNAVVTTGDSDTVTLYWPYPEGTDINTEFQIVHYDGLDRDDNGALASGKYENDMELYSVAEGNLENTPQGIKITVDSFSPFALFWEDDGSGDYNPPIWTPGGDGDGPSGLNTEDHFSYIVGYAEDYRTGEPTDDEDLWPVKPNNQITRAEVATIFYRLLEDEVRDEYDTTTNDFSDVTADSWYNQTVSTLARMGIVKGYEDGTFRPNAPITRAEFGAIATRFFAETGATYEPGTFTDVTGDEWYANAIQDAVNLGLIGGYPDGTVRPNNNITRAEACAIVNRTLGRVPDADHLLPEDVMKVWPDNNPTDWFYADMQEATNGHEYAWIEEDGHEIEEWTNLLDKDWTDR